MIRPITRTPNALRVSPYPNSSFPVEIVISLTAIGSGREGTPLGYGIPRVALRRSGLGETGPGVIHPSYPLERQVGATRAMLGTVPSFPFPAWLGSCWSATDTVSYAIHVPSTPRACTYHALNFQ